MKRGLRGIFVFSLLVSIFFISFLSASVSVRLADHGTDVRNSTNDLLEEGNLTITIHDLEVGGNEIFSQNFVGGIVNGSWNVIIVADMEYGKTYWKDYSVNGEDLDFSGNERLEFHSPLGYINDETFFNFSLIDSCGEGYAIKQINENGSVECVLVSFVDTQKSGNGYLYNDSSSIYLNDSKLNETIDSRKVIANLSDYAMKNGSETFAGNITTTYTGFFGWIGSLVSRVAKIFVSDIDVNGNLTLNGTAIDDWSDVVSDVIDTNTEKSGEGYLYNNSDSIYLNESMLNVTISELDTNTLYNVDGNYIYNNGSNWFYLNETRLNEQIVSEAMIYNETNKINSLNDTKLENGTDVWFDNVGIGTSNSVYSLDINSADNGIRIYRDTNPAFRMHNSLTGTDNSDGFLIEQNGDDSLLVNYENANMRFFTGGTEKMRITSDGSVGIGTETVGNGYILDIAGDARVQGNLTVVGETTELSVQNLNINGSVTPDEDSMFNIGNSTNRWRNGSFTGTVNAGHFVGDGSGLTGMKDILWENSSGDATFVSGNVGIGTSSPSQKLEVVGTVNLRSSTIGGNVGLNFLEDLVGDSDGSGAHIFYNGSSNALHFDNYVDGNFENNMVVFKRSGNVGIGVNAPVHKLQVYSSNNIGHAAAVFSGDYYGVAVVTQDDSTKYAFNIISNATDNLGSNGDSRFLVRNDGNVGIGTTTPSNALEVEGGIVSKAPLSAAIADGISISHEPGYSRLMAFGPDDSTAGNMRFVIGESDGGGQIVAMSIDSSGDVGIGTTNPQHQLSIGTIPNEVDHVNLRLGVQNGLVVANSEAKAVYMHIADGGSVGVIDAYDYSTTSSYPLVLNPSGGNVGIGAENPFVKLEVDGIIKTTPASSRVCDANSEGGIMYDSDDKHFYGCNGVSWVQLD